MILVELDTGNQRLFGSLPEFSAAVRRGEVASTSRIYHRTSGQWLPITTHPAFRLNQLTQPDTPLPPLARTRWTFFSVEPHAPPAEEPSPPVSPDAGDASAGGVTPLGPSWRRALGHALHRLRSPQ